MPSTIEEFRARLAQLPTSAVSDGLGKRSVVGDGLRRLTGSGRFCGPAVTAACADGSSTAIVAAVSAAEPGDVLCVNAPGHHAYLGDILATEVCRRQLAAIVVDGHVRDLEGLRDLGITVYARGVTPLGAGAGPPGVAATPVTLGRTVVTPGDLILGDDDGVVAIPRAEAESALERSEAVVSAEEELLAKLRGGQSLAGAIEASGVGPKS
jgi:regulator of RNase E activity RraA